MENPTQTCLKLLNVTLTWKSGKVIVKANGKSYADLLKAVKRNVNLEELGVNIKRLKKTQHGDLLVEVPGKASASKFTQAVNIKRLKKTQHGDLLVEVPGKASASKFTQAIKSVDGDAEVILKTDNIVIHINNIDADISAEGLKEEIKKYKENLRNEDINNIDADISAEGLKEEIKKYKENLRNEDMKLLSLRPMYNGSQAATLLLGKDLGEHLCKKGRLKIGLGKDLGEHLCKKGRLKIGWSSCVVEKRVKT
ncbi:hypothetical protein QE152_g40047 [Popillia japonica]|uniref:Uncharacterized protein n=1 Tax=Popillia japonica TaxID=7064 RepID=A0AAW1HT15_POPJA